MLTGPNAELPEDLAAWTFDTVRNLVERHEFEPGVFDYKAALTGTGPGKDQLLSSLQKTASSLANTAGGFILFGVKDRAVPVVQLSDRITGLVLGGDWAKEFGDKMKGLQQDIFFEASPKPIVVPFEPSKGVFVVRIPLSPRRPHMVRSTGVFYKRSEGGSAVEMDFYEVRDQILLSEERSRKLTLLRMEVVDYFNTARIICRIKPAPILSVLRFDTTSYKTLVADCVALLPRDDSFVQLMLFLARQAQMANGLLDAAANPAVMSRFTVDSPGVQDLQSKLLGTLDTLESLAGKVDRTLTETHGPLIVARLLTEEEIEQLSQVQSDSPVIQESAEDKAGPVAARPDTPTVTC